MGTLCIDFKKLGIRERIAYGEGRLRSFNFVRPLKANRVSTVWLVQSKNHKTFCALKKTKKLVARRNNVVHLPINEQSILGSINHSLISNIIEAFQDSSNLYIVLQYMPCGSLREYLTYSGCLTESQTRFVIICILIALEYLHKQQIAHLDIKPENLLIDKQGYFRLCDFNLSVDCKAKHKKDKKFRLAGVGTYGYQAPEIRSNPSLIGKQSDLYSVGVMCAEMLTGINKRNTDQFTSSFLKERLQQRVNISNSCIDFISKLLQDDPMKRLGSRGNFQQIWKHPWLQVSPTQRLQYVCKQVPSFVHDQYRKNKQIDEEQDNVTQQIDEIQDEMVDRLMIEDQKFQNLFSQFKTIAFKPSSYQQKISNS